MNKNIRRALASIGSIDLISDNYLTIEALEDGLTASLSTNACEYCIDGDGNWLSLAAGATTQSVNTGHTLSFRGNLTPTSSAGIGTFTISKRCNLEGNCMSMLFGDNVANNLSLTNYAFYKLFYNCTNIIRVSSNFLPATTLANYCYEYMFQNCTSLVNAPALPATKLANYCYSNMFYGCTSLTTAPELPATTLANYCYRSMFYGCSSLTTAPSLPATTLAAHCYSGMFSRCSKLTTAPALPVTILANYCYRSMFYGCSSLTTAPSLPATTLADGCYEYMFYGCSKLNYIKMLATNISATDCLYNWVSGVASTGTFVKNPAMTSLPTGTSGIPSGWTVVDDGEESVNGDKVVNKVQLVEGSIEWELMFDYPINSSLQVKFANGLVVGLFKGKQQYSTGFPKFNKPTIVGIDPLEDDKYIYTW